MKKKLRQLHREREEATDRLGEVDVEMVYKDYTVINYRIHVVRRRE